MGVIGSRPMAIATNRQLTVTSFGIPSEVIQAVRSTVPEPGVGEVLVRTQYAPINPADLNVLEGRYGKLPELPAVVGNEGSGQVVSVGPDVEGLAPGDLVIYLHRSDCWQDYVLATPSQLLRLPAGLDAKAASMLKINPSTAWLLLHQFADLNPGDWIIQNASNSGVGQAVIAIAKAKGWRTANFVRREELIAPLSAIGADLVVLDDDDGKASALESIDDSPVRHAHNAVGGESALRIMSMLSDHGTHVTYGAMGRRPLKIPNSFLIFKNLEVRGLWVTRWLESAPRSEIETVYRELAKLMIAGKLPQPVETTFEPEKIAAAVEKAAEPQRSGKVLLDFQAAASDGN
jgi:trans-2-enoyl-CoA reductase